MKKFIVLFLSLIAFTIFGVIVLKTPSTVLYLLNWGEYINYDLIDKFEKEYNCQVYEEQVTSSEIMYQKIASGTTAYDVAIPGDYCVRQLYKEGYLIKLDTNNIDYKNLYNHEDIFNDNLKYLMDKYMIDGESSLNEYYMPYFWGAYSIIYSNNNSDVENVVLNNGFKSLYDRSLYQSQVKIGMYDTARWAVMSYLLSIDRNPNVTSKKLLNDNDYLIGDIDELLQDEISNALMTVDFDQIGNDQLKRNVARGDLDLCFTQLGDFFDALYLMYDEGKTSEEINFNVCVPENTCAFFDSMVIPTTSLNNDLANKFINFMLEPENAYLNALEIGYCPTLKEVCNLYNADTGYYYEGDTISDSLTMHDFLIKYPMYLNPLYKVSNLDNVYLLDPKSNEYYTTCEIILNSIVLIE